MGAVLTAVVRYVVVGAGAVGGTIGGRLAQHGHDVVLVARGAHAERLAADGLRMLTPDGPVHVRPAVATGPDDVRLTPADVLVLAVKVQDTASVLPEWAAAPLAGGPAGLTAGARLPVVCAQNGLEGDRLAQRWFRHVVGACVYLPATHLEPGTVVAEGAPVSGALLLGRTTAGPREHAERVAADLSGAGFAARAVDDVGPAQRGKLLSNTANAVDAVVREQELDGEAADALREDARAEGAAVFAAAGLPVADQLEALPELRGLGFGAAPVAGAERGGSSSWQSLRRGGTVETDWLNGEVVRRGRVLGVPTPVNEALQVLADAAARSGAGPRTLAVADVRRLVDELTRVS